MRFCPIALCALSLGTTLTKSLGADPPNASKVKIQSTTGNTIQLNEVEVIVGGINVALGKTATQGSTFRNKAKFDASNAIDGDMETFSHTQKKGCNWLEIDLGSSLEIEGVVLHNRPCKDNDAAGCLCRLSHATVSLLNDAGQWVPGTWIGNTCEVLEWEYFFVPDTTANPSESPTLVRRRHGNL